MRPTISISCLPMSEGKGAGRAPADQGKLIASNRRARHDYDIEETFEAGIELAGSEVKSMRQGLVAIRDSYAQIEGDELYLYHLHINEYQTSPFALEPTRRRKLLVHRAELSRLIGLISRKGMTLVPLRIYFSKRGWAKVEVAVARGRKGPDRREDIKKKAAEREMREARRR